MASIKITRSSDKDFPDHQPIRFEYYLAFDNVADFAIYEIDSYEALNFLPNEEFTFEIIPNEGEAIKFVGILYDAGSAGAPFSSRSVSTGRLHFVSKYYKKLVSAVPLYGRGKTSDIIGSFYAKATVPIITKDPSSYNMENALFDATTRIDEAITYMLNRSYTQKAYLLSTVIGDTAYIRDITNGKNAVDGIYYTVQKIADNRLRVDALGGIALSMLSDAEDAQKITNKFKDTSKINSSVFYSVGDKAMNRAKAKVKQARIYFNNYTSVVSTIGWLPLIGSNIVVTEKDPLGRLERGTHYVSSQVLAMDFRKSYESTQCGLQLVA